MKILAISDEEVDALREYYQPGRLKDYDLIISCGDLNPAYLEFLVTVARCPLLYVHGNHDTSYAKTPPLGCDCIEDRIVVYHGLRILGLGGCRRYHPGAHQYSEKEMRKRIQRLKYRLWRMGGVDIVVTMRRPVAWAMGRTGLIGDLLLFWICWININRNICSMASCICATAAPISGSCSMGRPR